MVLFHWQDGRKVIVWPEEGAALPNAAVESAPVSKAGKVFAIALLAALALAVAPVAEAEPSIRIGATLAQTGVYAALGQNQLRGYQLCVEAIRRAGSLDSGKASRSHSEDGPQHRLRRIQG